MTRTGLPLVFLFASVALEATIIPAPAAPTPPDTVLSYQLPAPELQAIVDAPREPKLYVAPDGRRVALVTRPLLPPISVVAEPQARLAGLRFNPQLRLATRFEFGDALAILDVETGQTRAVAGLPAFPRIVELSWAPDGRLLALSVVEHDAIRLWLVDAASLMARRASEAPLNAIVDNGFAWFGGSTRLLVRLRPEAEAAAPVTPTVPLGPNVQSSDVDARASQLATFEDLLKTPFDETLLDHYLSAQAGVLDIDGTLTRVGPVGRVLDISGAPDGRHILVSRLQHPYSRIVPLEHFPREFEVWNVSGRLVHSVARTPLVEVIAPGPDAVDPGPRDFAWRADCPATLYWVEAQDGGDPGAVTPVRDIVYSLAAPFDGPPVALLRLPRRLESIFWGRGDLALASDWTWKTRDADLWRFNPDSPAEPPTLVEAWSFEDRYGAPGSPLTRTAGNGAALLWLHGASVFMAGPGATPAGERPFLRRLDLELRTVTDLWRSDAPYFEQLVRPLDDEGTRLLTLRESTSEPPNLVVHERPDDAGVALTHFPNPNPQLAQVKKQVLRYKRADGVELTANLYLPPGYDAARDGPLPALLWAYPQEFKSAAAASQVKGSPYRFNAISFWGPLPFIARGFAVLDDPTMPIVGEASAEPNDTYVTQLVADAQAAIDELVRLGVGDRQRMAIGGHSYGAFMTANLLANSRLFRVGIARSGAYNRTLTPFGFQAEDRNFWSAREVYLAMSPFVHADQFKDPLLLIHGELDNNSGTYPIQSERMFQALKGLGRTVRLVMLPNESHAYRARESILHMLWEEDRWLTIYVKDAPRDGVR